MAEKEPAQFPNYRDVPDLKDYLLEDVISTGKHLGTGSFGSVVEVTVGGTLCAGKKLHVALLDPEDEGMQKMVDRFVSECKLMSKVRHPNIVQFMGLCFLEESPHPMLIMERLDTNLDIILEKKKNLPFPLVLHILLDITKGLVYLHSLKPQPIIHRDLTARNILLNSASMQAKIADLGNAMMIDQMKLSRTLSQAPGTTPYMPPEALQPEAKYNTMLDVFSFGHLALFAVLEEFPGDLLAMTYSDPLTDELKARSEVERREVFIRKLFAKLSKEHPITKLILQCLHNVPDKRPNAQDLMEKIGAVDRELDDIEVSTDLVEQTEVTINLITQEEPILAVVHEDSEPRSSECEQVAIAGGTSQVEDYDPTRSTGTATNIPVQRIEALKNGTPVVLQIYKSTGVIKKSSWHHYVFKIKNGKLQYSRSSKMDKPLNELKLSSIVFVKACPSEESKNLFCFEIHFSDKKGSPWKLGAFTQEERISWMEAIKEGSAESTKAVSQKPGHSRALPPVPGGKSKAVQMKANEAYGILPVFKPYKPPATSHTPYVTTHTTKCQPPFTYNGTDSDDETEEEQESYEYLNYCPREAGSSYETVNDYILFAPTKEQTDSAVSDPTLPTNPSDLTMEHLAKADPRQAQLWMLLQIQKVVQKMEKMEDMYESAGYLRPPVPLPPNMLESPSAIQSRLVQPTRKDLYVNLSADSQKKSAYKPLPPLPPPPTIPPKTYNKKSHVKDSDSSQPGSIPGRQQTLVLGDVNKEAQIEVYYRDYPQQKMIDTLVAQGKILSSEIVEHLVIEDDEESYVAGNRPDWAKANTFTVPQEISLEEMQKQALYISQNTLGGLQEIGEGQFGKIYKGLYKKPGDTHIDAGIEVAIKTIKKYDSKTEMENFLKEMSVMSMLIHPNVVRFYGLVQKDNPWMILEYCSNRSLSQFLTNNHRPVAVLIRYMLDVAVGMHYIAEKGLVHRDLAARNIMVGQDEICKVGDFGLLRELPQGQAVYVAKTDIPLPLRWMAPESLENSEFSTASDVWSFGIIMWEMYNPTESPYGEVCEPLRLAMKIARGMRLKVPEPYPPTVAKIMKACWHHIPTKRPSFLLIASLLTTHAFTSSAAMH